MKTRIIQIDDDFINNMANERLMKKMGIPFEVTNFLDPTEALNYLSETKDTFDLMLLDINMPRISGWEFLDRYEKFETKIPIMMLTSSLDPNDQKRANASKLLSGFYVKPLSKDMIEEILKKCGASNPSVHTDCL
ncbi:MAG: response regulator [Bacteroidetes bacterium B1(2017)]|nr:MAG: response regulator [Bacteroidetes bacterium B1(2017)]